MQIESEELRVLTQIGFIAAAQARVTQVEAIFTAVEMERPANAAAYVGLAMAYLVNGRVNDALLAIDRGLRAEGQADVAELHAFRGLALQLAGRTTESAKALRQAGAQPLAQAMLGSQ